MSTIIDRKIAVRVTNTMESPYTINKNTQIAELSVVTPEQSKFIKPVDMAILSMIPEGDPDLIVYLTELLRTNKPDQQNNTFWFPTLGNPGNTDDHTPIQTRILKELRELQRKEKLKPKGDVLIFVLHISLSARLCLAHTAYFNWSPWTSRRPLLASLSSNIFFGDNNRGRRNSSLNSCFIVRLGRVNLRKEDDTVFGHTPQIDSKNVANKLLHCGFIFSFMKFIFILISTMINLSASNEVIIIFSRTH